MKLLKRIKWRLDYAITMRRDVGMPMQEGWRMAGVALEDEPESLHEMDGNEAALVELSYWYD